MKRINKLGMVITKIAEVFHWVESLEDVGELNKNVAVNGDISALENYDQLKQDYAALQAMAAALEANTDGKKAPLGSEAYSAYLAQVEAHNTAVNA